MTVRLGTRASTLAMTQSGTVARMLTASSGLEVELVPLTTHGDVATGSLASLGGTGVFATALREALHDRQLPTLLLHSAAADRHTYLQRPDLGRRLHEDAAQLLVDYAEEHGRGYDLAIVIADGLSSLAVQRHSLPFLDRLLEQILEEGWSLAPITLVEQGRVAVADEIGERLGAKMTVILIGERPGLSSPDSLGLYFTYGPKVGLNDAYRNCISNVRLEGLSYGMATFRLMYLMREACRRQLSGVDLKDEAEVPTLEDSGPGNFLLPDQR